MVGPSNVPGIYKKTMDKCQAKCMVCPSQAVFCRLLRDAPEHSFQRDLPALSARTRMSFQRCRMPESLRAQGLAGDEAY
jgi:hypothetical protein